MFNHLSYRFIFVNLRELCASWSRNFPGTFTCLLASHHLVTFGSLTIGGYMNSLQPSNNHRTAMERKIAIYCDDACIPNPGVMGIGVVYGDVDRVYSACLGGGTNRAAE
jgi:hypothetical protein